MDPHEDNIVRHYKVADIIRPGEIEGAFFVRSQEALSRKLAAQLYRRLPTQLVDFGAGFTPMGLLLANYLSQMPLSNVVLVDPRYEDKQPGFIKPANVNQLTVVTQGLPDALPEIEQALDKNTGALGILCNLINYISITTLTKIVQSGLFRQLAIINNEDAIFGFRHPNSLRTRSQLLPYMMSHKFAPSFYEAEEDSGIQIGVFINES